MKSAKNRQSTSLYQKINNSKFDFYKNKIPFLLVPVAIILTGIILLCVIGFNLGIDFTGGTIINVVPKTGDMTIEADYNDARLKISETMNEYGIKVSSFQTADTDDGIAISFRYQDPAGKSESEMNVLNDQIIDSLQEKFGIEESDYENQIKAAQRIGATSSSELLLNAFLAILVAAVLILIYIAIRFEVASGLTAIVALLSDVLVVCSLVLIFRIEINSPFVAALITIIGYSINNTIIIFDRVRENIKAQADKPFDNGQIINVSIRQTLIRTLNTTITTLLSIVLLAIIGVPSIREFTLPIIFGLCAGTYSSIFVAPSLWALVYKPSMAKKKKIREPSIDAISNQTPTKNK